MPRRRRGRAGISYTKTHCALCRELGDCAQIDVPERSAIAICRLCLSDATAIATARWQSVKRPHKRPCHCMDCLAWDRAREPDPELLQEFVAGDADDTTARARVLEVDF